MVIAQAIRKMRKILFYSLVCVLVLLVSLDASSQDAPGNMPVNASMEDMDTVNNKAVNSNYQDEIMTNPITNSAARVGVGSGNSAVIIQGGNQNSSSVTQSGNNNWADQSQYGDNNSIYLKQTGKNNRHRESQTGKNNRKVIIQKDSETVIDQVVP
jgi:hypothetical protein